MKTNHLLFLAAFTAALLGRSAVVFAAPDEQFDQAAPRTGEPGAAGAARGPGGPGQSDPRPGLKFSGKEAGPDAQTAPPAPAGNVAPPAKKGFGERIMANLEEHKTPAIAGAVIVGAMGLLMGGPLGGVAGALVGGALGWGLGALFSL